MSRIAEPRGAESAASSAGSAAVCAVPVSSRLAVKMSSWMSTTRSSGAIPASWKWRRRTTPIGLASVAQ
jgi:hypothetical protein